MGFLTGKHILLMGLLSKHSIAYGVAQSCKREGAELAFTYANERSKRRIEKFAAEFESKLVFHCNVNSDTQISKLFKDLSKQWDLLDGVLHSISFAPSKAISEDFLDGLSRRSFQITHDISTYSFPAIAKVALPMLSGNASLVTLTYLGAERVVPNYNMMGIAKASLEASIRYLASSLGSRGVRVNGISSGPIKTLSASCIKDFYKLLKYMEDMSPLHRNVTIEEIGNVAAFLFSNLSSGITGEIIYVDCGFNVTSGIPTPGSL